MVRPSANPPQQHRPNDHKGEKCGNDEGKKAPPRRHCGLSIPRRSSAGGARSMRDSFSVVDKQCDCLCYPCLRHLIPQNNQKRDKASFLLEVIEYVQFLQEKLQMYEGSYHGYNCDQNKLIPWGGKSSSLESHVDSSRILKVGANQDAKDSTTQAAVLTGVKNLLELQEDPTAAGDTQTHTNMFPYIQHGVLATNHATEPVVADLASDPQTNQVWPVPVTAQCLFPNNVENDQEQLTSQSDYSSFSSAFSQGIVNNLTHAL